MVPCVSWWGVLLCCFSIFRRACVCACVFADGTGSSQALATGDTFDLGTWAGSGVKYAFDVLNGTIVGEPYGPSG